MPGVGLPKARRRPSGNVQQDDAEFKAHRGPLSVTSRWMPVAGWAVEERAWPDQASQVFFTFSPLKRLTAGRPRFSRPLGQDLSGRYGRLAQDCPGQYHEPAPSRHFSPEGSAIHPRLDTNPTPKSESPCPDCLVDMMGRSIAKKGAKNGTDRLLRQPSGFASNISTVERPWPH
jgi:hypothetical protein